MASSKVYNRTIEYLFLNLDGDTLAVQHRNDVKATYNMNDNKQLECNTIRVRRTFKLLYTTSD